MMGIAVSLLLLICAVALSSLNAETVTLNLYWHQLNLPMGFLLLLFAVCGLLCGLMVAGFWWVWPAKRSAVHWKRQFHLLQDEQAKEVTNKTKSQSLLP